MNAPQASLRIGDFCRFDGQLCELIAFDGVAAKLRRSNGQLAAVKISALFSDNDFEVITPSVRRRPIPPAYFDSLPAQAQERTLWLEHHITEVLDGLPAGANPTASPREGYDPAKVSLQQREANKIAELEASGTPLLLKCFQRFRRGYERHGLEALIDRRAVRRRSPTGRIDLAMSNSCGKSCKRTLLGHPVPRRCSSGTSTNGFRNGSAIAYRSRLAKPSIAHFLAYLKANMQPGRRVPAKAKPISPGELSAR